MKKLFFIVFFSLATSPVSANCLRYNFANYNNGLPSLSTPSYSYNDGLGYIVRSTSAGDFVSGPNGYFGTGHCSGNNYFYNDWDGNHGFGRWSGDTFYYNAW